MQVAPGIFRIEAPLGERIVCAYLLHAPGCTMLIDSGLHSTPQDYILPYLRSMGLPASIDLVLTTHADFDHMGGNAALKDIFPRARFLAHPLDRAWIEDIDQLIAERYGEFREDHGAVADSAEDEWIRANAHGTAMTGELQEEDEIQLDRDWSVRVLHTPGHTLGHVSVFDSRSRSAIIADAALSDGLYSRDGMLLLPPTYRYVQPYRDTLRALQELAPDLLLTSHYEVLAGSRAGEFLNRSMAYMERMEHAIVSELKSASGALSASQLIERLSGRLGSWPPSADRFLFYPLVGHLEDLQQRQIVAACRRDDILYYRIIHE